MQAQILRCQECGATLAELGVACRFCGSVSVAAPAATPAPMPVPAAPPPAVSLQDDPRNARVLAFLKSADSDVAAHWGPQSTLATIVGVGGTIGAVYVGKAIDFSPGLPIIVGIAGFIFWVASATAGDKPYMEKVVFPRLRQLMQEDQVSAQTVLLLANAELKEGSALRKELGTSFSG